MFVIRRPLKVGTKRRRDLMTVGLEQASELMRNVAVEIVGGHAGSAGIGHDPVIDDGPVPAIEGQRGADYLLGQVVLSGGQTNLRFPLLEVARQRPDRDTVRLENGV